MWIFTKNIFVSAVMNFENPCEMLVRFRTRDDAESFVEDLPENEGVTNDSIIENAGSDYAFRVFVQNYTFTNWIEEQTQAIDYPNFKNAACKDDPARGDAYFRVWDAMKNFQDEAIAIEAEMENADEDVESMSDLLARETVFVYGSLLSGLGNHYHVEESDLLMRARTVDAAFTMRSLQAYPGVVKDAESGGRIIGEAYSVDRDTFQALDRLEGHPRFYTREKIMIEDRETGEQIQAWIYLLPAEAYKNNEAVTSGDWKDHQTNGVGLFGS